VATSTSQTAGQAGENAGESSVTGLPELLVRLFDIARHEDRLANASVLCHLTIQVFTTADILQAGLAEDMRVSVAFWKSAGPVIDAVGKPVAEAGRFEISGYAASRVNPSVVLVVLPQLIVLSGEDVIAVAMDRLQLCTQTLRHTHPALDAPLADDLEMDFLADPF
jgi:hypothetical protein